MAKAAFEWSEGSLQLADIYPGSGLTTEDLTNPNLVDDEKQTKKILTSYAMANITQLSPLKIMVFGGLVLFVLAWMQRK